MGLPESSLTTIAKPFGSPIHCEVSCDSPCCTKLFGEIHHCVLLQISVHTETLSAIAMNMKLQINRFQNNQSLIVIISILPR